MNPTSIVNAWLTSLIRLAIAGAGGFVVRKGIVDQSLWEATAGIIVGGGIAAFWGLYEKYHVQKYVQTALAMPQGSSPELLTKVVAADVTPIPGDTKADVVVKVQNAELEAK